MTDQQLSLTAKQAATPDSLVVVAIKGAFATVAISGLSASPGPCGAPCPLHGPRLLLPPAGEGRCADAVRRWRSSGKSCRWQFLLLLLRPGSPSPTAFALPSRWRPLPGAVETNAPPSESPWSLQDFALRAVNPGLWWRWGDSNPRPTPTYFSLQGLSTHTTISLRADESPQCPANHQEMMLLASRYAPLATPRIGSGIRTRPAPTLDGGALRAPVGCVFISCN